MKKLTTLFCIAILLISVRAWGTTYYVCTGGDASAPTDGTCANAYGTIQAAIDLNLAANDIVDVMAVTPGGTEYYRESLVYDEDDDGTSGNHVVLQGHSGDTIIISGADLITPGTSWTDDELTPTYTEDFTTSNTDDVDGNTDFDLETDGSSKLQIVSNVLTHSSDTVGTYGYVRETTLSDEAAVTVKFTIEFSDILDVASGADDYRPIGFRSDGSTVVGYLQFNTDANSDIVNYSVIRGNYDETGNTVTMTGLAANTPYDVYVYVKTDGAAGGITAKVGAWAESTSGLDDDTSGYNGVGDILFGAAFKSDWGDGTNDTTISLDDFEVYLVDARVGGSANIWRATLTTTPTNISFATATYGTTESAYVDMDTEYDWYYCDGCGDGIDNTLYVYSTTDPDTEYTSPGIEAHVRQDVIRNNGVADYTTIKDITIEKAKRHGIYYTSITDITIDNIVARYNGGPDYPTGFPQGFNSDNNSNVLVKNSSLYGNGWNGLTNSNYAGAGNMDNIIVEYCEAYNNYHQGFDSKGGSHDFITNLIYRYNRAWDNGNHGIYLQGDVGGGDITTPVVHGNVTFENTLFGINIDQDITGALIYNNTCTKNVSTGMYIHGSGVIVKNNIIAENQSGAAGQNELVSTVGAGIANVVDNNLIHHSSNTLIVQYNSSNYNYADYLTQSSQQANGKNVAPLFTNAAGDDFTLKFNSPCRHGATYLSGYETKLRPNASWPSSVTTMDDILSIGAYGIYRGSAEM